MSCAAFAIREVATTTYRAHARSTIAADPDAVDQLGDEIATLSAHIHAATHRLLVMIAEFDRLRGWEQAGQRSCAHWLAVRTGIDLGAAREKVRAARALERLPLTSAAMSRGELSFSQVRALSRAAEPETEAALLELARGATVVQLERMVRAWKKGSRIDGAAAARERYESRTLSVFPDDDGMYAVRGRLTPELGALLMRAIEAAGDALYREHQPASSPAERERAAAQRRADAIGLLAERALAAGFGTAVPTAAHTSANAPISGTRAQRYQVIVHVDQSSLTAGSEPGRAELEDGMDVSAETCRRLACDASMVRVAHDPEGSVAQSARHLFCCRNPRGRTRSTARAHPRELLCMANSSVDTAGLGTVTNPRLNTDGTTDERTTFRRPPASGRNECPQRCGSATRSPAIPVFRWTSAQHCREHRRIGQERRAIVGREPAIGDHRFHLAYERCQLVPRRVDATPLEMLTNLAQFGAEPIGALGLDAAAGQDIVQRRLEFVQPLSSRAQRTPDDRRVAAGACDNAVIVDVRGDRSIRIQPRQSNGG
jgi:hypothetical protein